MQGSIRVIDATQIQFREFVERALVLSPAVPDASPLDRFRAFARRATPLLEGAARERARELLPAVELLTAWRQPHDLLHVAGLTYDEDAYTELLAWAVCRDTHEPSALDRQCALLATVGVRREEVVAASSDVRTQVWTLDGVPDLVIDFDRFVLVVEAKTGSDEHEAPSGKMQTVAYPAAVATLLKCDPDEVRVAFLTPDRRPAANARAAALSYAQVALALATALEGHRLPDDVWYAFASVIEHFVHRACPIGLNVESCFDIVGQLAAGHVKTSELAGQVAAIETMHTLLVREAKS